MTGPQNNGHGPPGAAAPGIPGDTGLSWGLRATIGLVALVAAVPAALGFLVSFESVTKAVEPSFGDMAWAVPVGVDAGIAVFTAIAVILGLPAVRARWPRLARLRLRGLRVVPWSLTAATIYLNVAPQTTVIGRVAHGVLPALWVITVEVVAHLLRALTETGPRRVTQVDRVRLSRWFLAPWPTLRLWRRMRLWEVPELAEGHRRSEHQDLARAALQDKHGPLTWRWKASRRDRVRFRYGHLSAADVLPEVYAAVVDSPAPQARAARTRKPAPTTGAPTTAPTRAAAAKPAVELDPGLLEVARTVARELLDGDQRVTRDALGAGIRARGHACPNSKVKPLMQALTAEGLLTPGRGTVQTRPRPAPPGGRPRTGVRPLPGPAPSTDGDHPPAAGRTDDTGDRTTDGTPSRTDEAIDMRAYGTAGDGPARTDDTDQPARTVQAGSVA